jgi:hypothetical protein
MTRDQRRQHLVTWAILAATIVTVLISALTMRVDRRPPGIEPGSGNTSQPLPPTPGAHP